MKSIDLAEWPFGKFLIASVCMSILQGIAQTRWAAIRYRTFGPRPPMAEAFIGLEVVLVMLVFGLGFVHLCDKDRTRSMVPYLLGILVAVGAWVLASFVL